VEVLPDFIASQLPPGVRHEEVAAGGQRVHAMVWGPEQGKTVVLVHGNPTWGFLWRKVVAALRAKGGEQLKLVVPDLVGLGLSSKPKGDAHTLTNHGEWIGAAIDRLASGPVVIVGQDWGGPIVLRAIAERTNRLRGIVMGNTAVGPPAKDFKPTLFHRLSHAPIVSDVLFRGLGFPLGVLHTTQGDKGSIRGDVARAYRWPLRRMKDRWAPLALARMVPDSLEHPTVAGLELCERVFVDSKVPVALVWGKKDPILGRVVNHAARLRPDATVTKIGAGHFLQEEVPQELADAVLDVVGRADWS